MCFPLEDEDATVVATKSEVKGRHDLRDLRAGQQSSEAE